MKTKPTHSFVTFSHNLKGLFEKTFTLKSFMKKLEEQSLIDPIRYESEKYLGDGFELFIELFLMLHPVDNRIGISEYEINLKDVGADGFGLNIKGEPCAIQVKYRSNITGTLTATTDHLSNLISNAGLRGINFDTKNPSNYRHFVFTTANGLHHFTNAEMYQGKLKCFGYKEIASMIDNNTNFWKQLNNILFN